MKSKLVFVFTLIFHVLGIAGGKTDIFLKFAQQNKDILAASEMVQVQWNLTAPEFKTSLYRIREKLAENAANKQDQAGKQGIILHQAIELPAMTAGFLIANGAINFSTLWDESGGNPLKFEEQIMAQKDPLTHFSFYAFMLANGVWFDYRSKDMSPAVRQANFRRLMYQGLAIGSFASTVVGDIGGVLKECATPHKPDPKDIEKACNEAIARMFSNGKVQQYISQIMTLLAVQTVTDFTHMVAGKALTISKDQIWKLAVHGATKTRFLATGVRFAITFNPVTGPFGGTVVMGATIIGMLANFINFVGIDHITNVPMNRLFTNLLRPPFFVAANKKTLEEQLEWGDRLLWNSEKLEQNFAKNRLFPTTTTYEKNILKELESFSTTMQDWRTHINSDVENYLNSWLRMTSRILSQVTVTEKYYQTFSTNLSDALTKRYNITRPPGTQFYQKQAAIDNSNDFPFRKMPLFGINFNLWTENNAKLEAEGKPALTKEQAPLMYPLRTTKEQSAFLKKYATNLLKNPMNELASLQISSEELNNINDLLNVLKDGYDESQSNQVNERNIDAQSKALSVFNYEFNSRAVQTQTIPYRKFIYQMWREIGIIDRKTAPGDAFNGAFEIANKTYFDQADFDLAEVNTPSWKNIKYKNLSTPTQYLMAAMVCGKPYGYLEEYWVMFWSPDFRPPSILRAESKPIEMCDTEVGKLKSYDFYTDKLTNPSTHITYDGIVDYIAKNYNPKILGDIFNDGVNIGVKEWLNGAVIPNVKKMLNDWDKKYQHIINKFEGNLYRQITEGEYQVFTEYGEEYTQKWKQMNVEMYKQIIDSFRFNDAVKILGEDWVSSIRYERDFYLNLMQAIRYERKLNPIPAKSWSLFDDVQALTHNQKPALLKPLRPEFAAIQSKIEELLAVSILEPKKINYLDYVKLRDQFQELFRDVIYPAIQTEIFRKYKPTGSVKKLNMAFLRPKTNLVEAVSEQVTSDENDNYNMVSELFTLAKVMGYENPSDFINELNTALANGMKSQVEFSNKVKAGLLEFINKKNEFTTKIQTQLDASAKAKPNLMIDPTSSKVGLPQPLSSFNLRNKIDEVVNFIATIDGRQFIIFQMMVGKARSEKKFEDVFKAYEALIKDSIREKIVAKSISQLITLEAQITRAVKFKVLMQQGLSFSDADISTLGIPGAAGQCPNGTKPGGGCR